MSFKVATVRKLLKGARCARISTCRAGGRPRTRCARGALRPPRRSFRRRTGRISPRRDDLTWRDDDLLLRRFVLEVICGAPRTAEPRPPGRPRTAHLRPVRTDSFRRCSTWSSPSLAPGRLAALAVFLDEPGLVLGDRARPRAGCHPVRPALVVEATVPVPRRPLSLVLGRLILWPALLGLCWIAWHGCKTGHCGHPRKGIGL